ncbi:MAG: Flp pilus assembly complex ATPase component TadA [Deltaproteobacteria bacterium]|nr:Flp pilus assembly complex ATPase component TadA [Deltaproteobacteria bacterium]
MRPVFDLRLPNGLVKALSIDDRPALWIGRDAACDVVLPSLNVSRQHVQLKLVEQGVEVSDQSRNGTWVDNTTINRSTVLVRSDAVLMVGDYVFELLSRVPGSEAPRECGDRPSPSPGGADPSDDSTSKAGDRPHARRKVLSAARVSVATRRTIHRLLLDHLELASLDRAGMKDEIIRPKVLAGLRRITCEIDHPLPEGDELEMLIVELCDEALGLGPLDQLLADNEVSEIMVVDPATIYAERRGRIENTGFRFTDGESVRAVIERIVTPLGRRIDESTPMVDARLKDGSRVNAVIPPLAIKGPCITIRKFAKKPLTIENLIGFGTLTEQMARFLQRSVAIRKNIVISGGTGSGKTTLLNVLSAAIPEKERIVTIEDAAELQLGQPHVVSLESRPPNMEGKGECSIRDLVKNALRMRPDRILVGECRGGEALDMLQAMNTGHEGSMTTTHANNPVEAVARLETLCLMAGLDLPVRAIRMQIAKSVHLIVQQSRFSDGSRRITEIAEVAGIDEHGEVQIAEIFDFHRTGTGAEGEVTGEFRLSGYIPSFIDEFIAHGLATSGDFL